MQHPQEESPGRRTGKDYEYYDTIVRDLISEIRERSSRDSPGSPQPLQKLARKGETFRVGVHKRGESEYSSIRVGAPREKMVFSLSLSGTDSVY
jgi:hypothetical protein